MHRFSIIVPMLGDRRLFDDTLASVLCYRPKDAQIIIVHDGTYDNPYKLQDEVEFVSTNRRAELIRFFYSALLEATGQFIALIRPGAQLTDGWSAHVESAFDDPRIASVAPIVTTSGNPHCMIAAGVSQGPGFRRQLVGCRKRITPHRIRGIKPIGPTSWAAFYRREALEQLGVCGERMDPHYLDLDVAMSLKTIGYKCAFCSDCIVSVERSSLVIRESILPHGGSAQRAFRRHVAQSGSAFTLVQSVCVFAQEIITSAIWTWRLEHAFQRMGARRFATLDRHYAELLSILGRRKRYTEGTEFPVPKTNRSKTEPGIRAA